MQSCTHTVFAIVCLEGPVSRGGLAVVHAQLTTIHLLPFQMLFRLLGAFDVDEVCVSEASGLASSAIDGDTDVKNVANLAEEI